MTRMMGRMKTYLTKKTGATAVSLVVFSFVVLVGIFFRTYHFHDWLYFYPDQARDASIVEDVISGKTGWPVLGPIAASTPFRVGPMYYYFQIVSAEIFGTGPEKMAYPDLLFGILSIPLLYYFLRRYFAPRMAFSMMGLYAVSFYAIRYSRFAWNPNPMPFFTMLFLLSCTELLFGKEKTRWRWVALLGIALGVGMQLHTILFLLLPTMTFLVSVLLLMKSPRAWKKIAAVLTIALLFNAGQIGSEIRTNFSNTRLLFSLSAGASQSGDGNVLNNLAQDLVCHSQANVAILSSLGDKDECNFFPNLLRIGKRLPSLDLGSGLFLMGVLSSIAFLGFGLAALVSFYRRETDVKKKYFLGLIGSYVALSFLILFPVIDGINLRYFLYLIFVPFFLLALLLTFVSEKYPRYFLPTGAVLILFCAVSNVAAIGQETAALSEKNKSMATYVVLGEIEPMRDYMAAQAFPRREAYLLGNLKYLQNYFKPLHYVGSKAGLTILRAPRNSDDIPQGKAVFMIGMAGGVPESAVAGRRVESSRRFGQNIIYQLGD